MRELADEARSKRGTEAEVPHLKKRPEKYGPKEEKGAM